MDNRLLIFCILVVTAVLCKLFFRGAYAFAKPLPVLFIIALAFLKPERVDALWLAAISFGLAGDLFLLKEGGFVPGLASFLLGHVFYLLLFYRISGVLYYTPPLILGVGAVAAGVYLYLARHMIAGRRKKYLVPVLLYTGISALLVMNAFFYPLASAAVGGAVLFALSDFLLAFNKFVRPKPYVEAGVSFTYYAAQWLLALQFRAL